MKITRTRVRWSKALQRSFRVQFDLTIVQSNMVVFRLSVEAPANDDIIQEASDVGIPIGALGSRTLRAVRTLMSMPKAASGRVTCCVRQSD